VFTTTHGLAAMWIVTSGAILLSIPVLADLQVGLSGHAPSHEAGRA
jgi:hypothetical protein